MTKMNRVSRRSRLLSVGGVLGPLVYTAAVILGGLIRPGYSHISQPISELIARGAPNKALLNPVFAAYNLLALAFALGVITHVRLRSPHAGRSAGIHASAFLILGGVVGLATLFFPQDPGGPPVTLTGTIHIALAGVCSLASMASIFLLAIWFQRTGQQAAARYSYLSLVVVFLSGAMAAITTATGGVFFGLLERLTIFAYLQWMFILALRLVKDPRSDCVGALRG